MRSRRAQIHLPPLDAGYALTLVGIFERAHRRHLARPRPLHGRASGAARPERAAPASIAPAPRRSRQPSVLIQLRDDHHPRENPSRASLMAIAYADRKPITQPARQHRAR